jgi:hypothetical protein
MHRLFAALSPPPPPPPEAAREQRLRWIRRRAYLNWSMFAFLPLLVISAIYGGTILLVVLACWAIWWSGLAMISLQIRRAARRSDRSASA